MHRLRDSLLSPSPKGFPNIGETASLTIARIPEKAYLAVNSRWSGEQLDTIEPASLVTDTAIVEMGWIPSKDIFLKYVTDMTDFWINNCGPMLGTQRLNFASYLAKVASTRICKDRMCQVALVIFQCAFEHRQEIVPSEDKDEEDPHRSMGSLELRHLLPAARAWFVLAQATTLNQARGKTNWRETSGGNWRAKTHSTPGVKPVRREESKKAEENDNDN
ncbi:hypothetical protein PENPOL_c002G03752 [Penicillium polonicum]|uniref:Uncharacterized protein n=1 Tax=Penicillium polonicum TaxID=60169 RepID=A0A1V6NZF0_PENPO|nr:hypothetical protein PENPOL_c002G03752 [Penicillium polonicum]